MAGGVRVIRPGLPAVPSRMQLLPIDARGYPVPWFVAWVDGVPDHRIVDPDKIVRAVREDRCFLCGERRGRYLSFVIGPMCTINRISAEPPSHRECARYAVRACPFLTRPHAVRRTAGTPDDVVAAPGEMLRRNPGVCVIWTTKDMRLVPADGGVLFGLGVPTSVEWYAEGRPASRDEVNEAVARGVPSLLDVATAEGQEAVQALVRHMATAQAFFPKE